MARAHQNASLRKALGLFTVCSPLLLPSLSGEDPEARQAKVQEFRKDEATFLAKSSDRLASMHYKLAKACEKYKLRRRARYHYLRAIEHKPDHSGARRALDHKRLRQDWIIPEEPSFEVAEEERIAPWEPEGKEEEAWNAYYEIYQNMVAYRTEKDLALARRARDKKLPGEERRVLRRITEYNPNNWEVRKELGDGIGVRFKYDDAGGGWYAQNTLARDILAGIKIGDPVEALTPREKRIPIPIKFWETEHYRFGFNLPEEIARHYAHCAEAGYQLIATLCPEVLEPAQPSEEKKLFLIILGKDAYKKVLEEIDPMSPEHLTLSANDTPTGGSHQRALSLGIG